MKQLTTDKGLQYEPEWCFLNNGDLIIKLADERSLSVVAGEFDGLAWLKCQEGDAIEEYVAYNELKGIRRMTEYIREPETYILITLRQKAG